MPQSQFLLTNGTDEAIQVLINTFVDDDDEVIVLTPSYAMYRFYAEVAGARVVNLPYRAGSLAFPLEELLAAITPTTRAILISNPNNPTGTGIATETIEAILKHAPHAAVLLDEAYYEFCGVTALPLIERYRNLFVSRTFSKAYGLAGLRIGCLFSQEDNVKFLHKAQSPYSVNILAAVAARAGVGDPAFVKDFVRQSILARDLLYEGFEKRGIPFYKSQGNFVLFNVGDESIAIRDGLSQRGVLVRDRSYEIAGCVRVTAGTPAQVGRFFAALDEVRK
jgi:histidinol-phosphate aminotransferase